MVGNELVKIDLRKGSTYYSTHEMIKKEIMP